jgi:hypothetical protein
MPQCSTPAHSTKADEHSSDDWQVQFYIGTPAGYINSIGEQDDLSEKSGSDAFKGGSSCYDSFIGNTHACFHHPLFPCNS